MQSCQQFAGKRGASQTWHECLSSLLGTAAASFLRETPVSLATASSCVLLVNKVCMLVDSNRPLVACGIELHINKEVIMLLCTYV